MNLFNHVIYRCIIGSRAYGLEDEQSDTDYRGFYLPPADLHWSLTKLPEQLENDSTQEVYWEIEKFIKLALKANPTILECLYTPIVELITPLAEDLIELRNIFLSQKVYETYNGYAQAQFKRISNNAEKGNIKWKHVMHMIRLLQSGIHLLKHNTVLVQVSNREQLLAIKRGELSWEEVDKLRLSLHKEFAQTANTLPVHPNYEIANKFLIKARRSAL